MDPEYYTDEKAVASTIHNLFYCLNQSRVERRSMGEILKSRYNQGHILVHDHEVMKSEIIFLENFYIFGEFLY